MADRNYWRSATERKSPHGSTIKDDHRNDRIRDHFKPGALPSVLGIQIGHGLYVSWAREYDRRGNWRQSPQQVMKYATKVSKNTVFFMEGGELYSASGMPDPLGEIRQE